MLGVDVEAGASWWLHQSLGLQHRQNSSQGEVVAEELPLPGTAMPHQVEPLAADMVGPSEGSIEFLAGIVRKSRAIVLAEAVAVSVSSA